MSLAVLILVGGCGQEMTAPGDEGLGSLSLLVVSGSGQSGVVGTELPQPLVVKVTNSKGVGIGGVTVNFRVVSGGGSMYAGTAVTDATNTTNKGNAADYWTLGTSTAQVQRVEVRAVTSTGQKQVYGVFTATALAAAAAQIVVQAGDGQTANVSSNVAIAPAVLVRDQYGNPVQGLAVTFAIASGGGSVTGGNPTTNPTGIATVGSWTLGSAPGTNTLTATASGSGIAGNPVTFTATASAPSNTWTPKAQMGNARTYLGVIASNGIVYAVGGNDGNGNSMSTVEAYDPAANTWTTRAPLLNSREEHGLTAINGILYAVGGYSTNGFSQGLLSLVEAFDPVSNTWTARTDMPTARSDLGVGAINGILYAVGGTDGSGHATATVEAYNPVTDTWTTKAPMPVAQTLLGVAVDSVNGILYAVGGFNTVTGQYLGLVQAYNPATNTWTMKADMLTPRSSLGLAVINGILYAVGGDNRGPLTTLEAYDLATNVWTTKADMPTRRWGLGAAAVNGTLYAVGGYNTDVLATVEAYHP